MMARTIWVVMTAVAVSAGAVAQPQGQGQPFDTLGAGLSSVEGQQPPVPSAAPTVQAGDTRPIHV